ncbi:TonB-dependent receptor [Phenylobacterium sp. SCN 70-31]|uniref:TonB-dependent receptor n=1 Tax=Phenylobacterium sp. SCN 70-31 TaxID=1660129 RepID=UPI000B0822A3|nr:TonB-dependent receptor [Phenylobacterium sp. SCN 70-31]
MGSRHRFLARASVMVLAAAVAAPVTPAAAQTIEELVVTARKREENVQDVPAVVSALSGENIRALGGVSDTRDLVQLLPGVTFIEAASKANAEPNIRGAGQARLPNSDAAIGLYRDGAYIAGGNIGGRAFQRFDLFDVERVESLRGPQGALYGRNAVGGAINTITRKPGFSDSAEVTVGYGDHDTLVANGLFNKAVTDTFAVRLGFDHTQQSGCIYKRLDTGGCFDFMKYGAGRLAMRWRPNDRFDATFVADYSDMATDSGGVGFYRSAPRPFDTNDVNGRTSLNTAQSNFNFSFSYDLGWADLYSTTNHRRRDSAWYTDPDGLTGNAQALRTDKSETTFHETRLQGEADRLNWLVGADLFYLKDDYNIRERGLALLVNTMTMTTINPNSDLNTLLDSESYGVFGSVEYSLTERAKLQAEARYSYDKKEGEIIAVRVDGGPRYVDFPPGSPQARPSVSFENLSWGVTASYRWTPELMTFARVATAFRAGGFNSELGNPCNMPDEVPGTSCNLIDVPFTYEPEKSITYEAGLKSTWWERRLLLNANVYWVEYKDLLANLNNGIPPMMDPLNGAMFLANAGDAWALGAEVDLSVSAPLPPELGQLTFTANYAHQEGEFRDPPAFLTTVRKGNKVARLRNAQVTGSALYAKPITEDWILRASLTVRHESGGFQGAENNTILDDYTVFGGRVALESQHWTLSVRAQNLFNHRYFTNQGGTQVSPGLQEEYRLNDPRYVEATVTYRW